MTAERSKARKVFIIYLFKTIVPRR